MEPLPGSAAELITGRVWTALAPIYLTDIFARMSAAPAPIPSAPRPATRSRYAVLGMLGMGLETGYAMKKHVAANLGHFWSESYGQIYPCLHQLLAEGLVTCRDETRSGRPRRRIYELTEQGHAALRDWLAEKPQPQPPRIELLLKLSFAGRVDPRLVVPHIEEHARRCRADLAAFADIERLLTAHEPQGGDVPYWLMTLRYGIAIRRAELDWCEQTLAHLQRIGQAGNERCTDTLAAAPPSETPIARNPRRPR